MTTIIGEMTRRVSEALILPFDCVTYAKSIENEFKGFINNYKADLDDFQIDLMPLKLAISNFTRNAQDFHSRLNSLDKTKLARLAYSLWILSF